MMRLEMNQEQKDFLLNLARETIKAKLENRKPKTGPVPPELTEEYGAFVTLHKEDRLRGCIGHIVAEGPLNETIEKMALSAAFRDPRFPPLQKEEYEQIDIEISVLSPLEPCKAEEVVVGRHGLYIKRRGAAGVLLPQVPIEQNWDRITFLDQTCKKAGLTPGCWKDPETELLCFEALVFGETERTDT